MKHYHTLFFIGLFFVHASFGQWQAKQSLPTGTERHHPVNFVLDGKAYYLTGMDANGTVYRDFYVYDPQGDSWTKKADFPGAARGFAYGAALDGKGYIGFGLAQSSYLNDLWEYDPVNDSWSQLSSCPCTGRRHPAFVAVNGKIFVGLGDNQVNLGDWWEYDVASDEWSSAPSFPGAVRHHPYYFGIGNNAYVGFGHGATIYKDFYKYDLGTKTWTRLNDFPGSARVAGTQQSYGGKGYILAGDGINPYHTNMATGEFWEYEPGNDSWTQLTPHPGQSRWAPGSFMIGNTIYLTSGETGSGTLWRDVWAYDLPVATGIASADQRAQEFNIVPNIAEHSIQIPNELIRGESREIFIYGLDGRLVHREKLSQAVINVSDLISQMYLVQIRNEDKILFNSRFYKK